MENTFIPRGMDIIKAAVECDNKDELDQALSLYKQGINYLVTGLKYAKVPSQKQAVTEKVEHYIKRAEEIKTVLEGKRNGDDDRRSVIAGAGADHVEEKDGDGKKGKKKDADQEKMDSALEGAIVKERPDVKWEDVAGLEQAKSLLKEAVILPVKFPQLFTGKRKPWKGILLYGPPGTGKSFLAKAVATEAGESERLVKTLFEMARKNSPSIIFIDEVDSLCGARGEGENESSRRIKTEFLVQMQGVGKDDTGILVLGATNTPWDLDPAIRRRFEKRVYIPLPDASARTHLFQHAIGDTPHTLGAGDIKQLADSCDGFSGADISIMVRDALYEGIRIIQLATHFRKIRDPVGKQAFLWEPCSPGEREAAEMNLYDIPSESLHPIPTTMRHFENVLVNAKPSVSPGDLQRFVEWTNQFGQEG